MEYTKEELQQQFRNRLVKWNIVAVIFLAVIAFGIYSYVFVIIPKEQKLKEDEITVQQIKNSIQEQRNRVDAEQLATLKKENSVRDEQQKLYGSCVNNLTLKLLEANPYADPNKFTPLAKETCHNQYPKAQQ